MFEPFLYFLDTFIEKDATYTNTSETITEENGNKQT